MAIETDIGLIVLVVFVAIFLLAGIKIVRPTHRAAVETLGKYSRFQGQGITYIIPFVQKLYAINITEQLIDVERQAVITLDKLNCSVDAQVYFKVGDEESFLKKALYNVNNYELQIVQLSRTTLRNVIGNKPFTEVNQNRNELNKLIYETLKTEAEKWGVTIARVELKAIEPPKEVQDAMDRIIIAEQTKIANRDFAQAAKIEAEGLKFAQIQRAEGFKKQQTLEAEGQAQAIITVAKANAERIKLVNEAASKYFIDNAVVLKQLEVTQASLERNSKIILTEKGISPTLVINESGKTIIPTQSVKGQTK